MVQPNPSPADADKFEAVLKRHNIPCVFHRYPNANHGFQNPARTDPRTPEEIRVADEAWVTMLGLMEKNHPARAAAGAVREPARSGL